MSELLLFDGKIDYAQLLQFDMHRINIIIVLEIYTFTKKNGGNNLVIFVQHSFLDISTPSIEINPA